MKTSGTLAGWLGNVSVRTKMLLAFGLLLALIVLNSAAFLYVQREQAEARVWTDHTHRVLGVVDNLLIEALNQQSGIRGYALAGNEDFLDRFRNGEAEFTRRLAEVRNLTRDNPLQQQRLSEIAQVMGEWRGAVAEPIIAVARDGGGAAAAAEITLRGRIHFDHLRSLLAAAVDEESVLLAQRMAALDRVTSVARVVSLATLLTGVALLIGALLFVQRLITNPLVHLTGLMSRLADKDHMIEVPDQRRADEIGSLARALQVFKQMVIATERSNWVKTHAGEISSQLQQVKSQQSFAEALTAAVAPLVQAGIAVFYAFDGEGERLELLGSYGYKQRRHVTPSYRLGEGLVGQCARERKPIILESVPDDYTRIHSGTGESLPRTVILLPILSQDRLLGVLEFASFGRFAEQQQQLLDELRPIISLSLENLGNALRTQQLLQETQAQSEELQASEEALRAQQEELRASNEALQAKTGLLQQQSEKLQASEEELRVQAEELRASNEELRQKGELLGEQTASLQRLQKETQDKADELARASQYKSDFLANMSHELRTPLNSLLILSRGLADNEAGNLSADEVESARVIHDSGSNLLRLINDILDLSKVEAGKMEIVLDDLPLADLTATISRNFRHVARERGLEFEVQVAEGLPAIIRTDAAKLEQITNNLLSNAFKFTKQGSVRVLIGRPAAGMAREGDIAIRVVDSGIGIPAEKFDKVFQAFEQVDAGTSRHYGGTGLGLSIARGMAQLLGGDIRVESTVGQGTTFTLLLPERHGDGSPATPPRTASGPPLPASAPAAVPATARQTVEPPAPLPDIPDDRAQIARGDTVILVIEDDPAFARILIDMIRRKGFRGLAAPDGERGLQLAAQFRPTGILLDVMLPGMDGWTVIERLKASAGTRHIPVHFISATEDQSRGLDLGAVGFLTKPVSREGLASAFDRLMHFAAGSTRRLLVVDDDAASRMAVCKLLASTEVEVVEAAGGEAALALLPDGAFDCIVLDLGMPGMDGFEFLERAARLGPVPPVVVYSGRELSRDENLRLREYTDSIVIKGARSPDRLLDEVSLFLHSVRELPVAVATPEGDRTLQGRTVLLVDDDMRNIFALSKALRAKGLKVVMAQDGHKAIRQLDENPEIELVLMDIMMPGMDGYETMREIRRDTRHQRLPMIALTAKAMRGDREKCLEAGANDYLSKPVDLDKLFSLMRVWLGGG